MAAPLQPQQQTQAFGHATAIFFPRTDTFQVTPAQRDMLVKNDNRPAQEHAWKLVRGHVRRHYYFAAHNYEFLLGMTNHWLDQPPVAGAPLVQELWYNWYGRSCYVALVDQPAGTCSGAILHSLSDLPYYQEQHDGPLLDTYGHDMIIDGDHITFVPHRAYNSAWDIARNASLFVPFTRDTRLDNETLDAAMSRLPSIEVDSELHTWLPTTTVRQVNNYMKTIPPPSCPVIPSVIGRHGDCLVFPKLGSNLFTALGDHSCYRMIWSIKAIALQVVDAMEHLHARHIYHAANICTEHVTLHTAEQSQHDASVFLLDIGDVETSTHHRAPEAFGAAPQFTPAGDIFAFAIFLWELCFYNHAPVFARYKPLPVPPPPFGPIFALCSSVDPSERPTTIQLRALLQAL